MAGDGKEASAPLTGGDVEQGIEMQTVGEEAAGTAAGTGAKAVTTPAEKVKLKGANGEETEVSLVPMLPCCGSMSPPGGWYGPFGFLRMVMFAFILLSLLGVVVWVWAIINFNWVGVALRWLLVPGALVAAFAAYSHEGLANEVTAMANENDSYAKKNDDFHKQLKDLGSVSDKLAGFAEKGEEHINKLEHTLEGIERVGDLGKVNTILRGFTDAEMRAFLFTMERGNRVLDNIDELSSFMDGTSEVLMHNIDTFDLKLFKKLGMRGIGLTTISLLTACACTEDKQESICLMTFIYFMLDPKNPERQSKASDNLVLHLAGTRGKFNTKLTIDAEMDRMVASTEGEGPVGEPAAQGLVQEVLDKKAAGASSYDDDDDDLK